MTSLLTAKDLQAILQVDRSTIYRMAETGRLPAIKVGRQWRFPSEQINNWLGAQTATPSQTPELGNLIQSVDGSLAGLLPREYVDDMAELLGQLLGVMVVVTDMDGRPISEAANPCGLFDAINQTDDAVARCVVSWKRLADEADLQPRFLPSHMGLLCARSFVRVGSELKGMVLVGGIAPDVWPPAADELETIAEAFGVAPDLVKSHVHDVFRLDETSRRNVLSYLPRMAQMLSQIANERTNHLAKLDAIATLAGAVVPTKEHQ
ncbi:MAG: PocR ligand-binding domain-containing protein [Acidimicrobiia bacterium]|nr:PocR ligand-binding domain-containing protein [Acidimicrobiia bacterium]